MSAAEQKDYADSWLHARQYLGQSYNHAISHKMAEAIRLAHAAIDAATEYVEALERHRVIQDARKRAQRA